MAGMRRRSGSVALRRSTRAVALTLGATLLGACEALLGLGEPTLLETAPGGGGANGAASSAGGGGAAAGGAPAPASGSGAGAGGSAGGGGGPTVDCDEQYGAVPGYLPCPLDACSFVFLSMDGQKGTCYSVCKLHGGECLGAWKNTGCKLMDPVPCTFGGSYDLVCHCSAGCGGGPPCSSGTCNGGKCT
jgi:hypothetical protein